MEIKVRIQRHLAVAHMARDDGQFVFVICRRGFEEMMGERFKVNDKVHVNVSATKIAAEGS